MRIDISTAIDRLGDALLDGWDRALEILLIIMAFDYLTGVVASYKTKTMSSSIGYYGLIKKASIFIVVILAAQIDRIIGNSNHIFRNCTAISFTVNDAISILENIGRTGIKFPIFLRNALIKLQQSNDTTAKKHLDNSADTGLITTLPTEQQQKD